MACGGVNFMKNDIPSAFIQNSLEKEEKLVWFREPSGSGLTLLLTLMLDRDVNSSPGTRVTILCLKNNNLKKNFLKVL